MLHSLDRPESKHLEQEPALQVPVVQIELLPHSLHLVFLAQQLTFLLMLQR
jgi:hypothetical protein